MFVGMLVIWILFLNFNHLPDAKKGLMKQSYLGPSYFVRDLGSVKSTVKISSIFVAFLEKINFTQ